MLTLPGVHGDITTLPERWLSAAVFSCHGLANQAVLSGWLFGSPLGSLGISSQLLGRLTAASLGWAPLRQTPVRAGHRLQMA